VVIDNGWSKISCQGAEAKTNSAPLSQMLAAALLGNAQTLLKTNFWLTGAHVLQAQNLGAARL